MFLLYNAILQNKVNCCRCLSTRGIVKDHYEVLKLSKQCTHKDIKESFIKLSKEFHPDLNKTKDAHKKFVEIKEAYNVLSKPRSRHLYDMAFTGTNQYSDNYDVHYRYRSYPNTDPWKDPSFYREQPGGSHHTNNNYYGIKGLKKASNFTVAVFCVSVSTVILGIQMMALRYSFIFKKDELIRRSNDAGDSLRQVKQALQENGNDLQIEMLREKLENIHKRKT